MKKAVVLIIFALMAVAAVIGGRWYRDNKMPNFGGKVELYVTPETTYEEVLAVLKPHVLSEKSLLRAFEDKQVSEYFSPGYYVLGPTNSSVYAARMLNNAWQSPVSMTLSGTMRLKGEIARKIGNQLMMDSTEVRRALDDKDLLKEYGFTPQNVFALIQPDTYQMYWTATMKDVLDRQKESWDAFWTQENVAKAKKLGLSKLEAATLASIVTGESNHVPEMPRIAGVYLNRLRIGMKLQADPTVAYCFGYKLNRVLLRHLEVDSKYNTYKYEGLPPGPICVPAREALEAVLNPDFGPGNLYFCANPDFSGTHVFARTLAEHAANARAFQAELNRRSAAKRKSAK